MAGVTGLEPAASGVTGRRSNQLSYTPAAMIRLGATPTPRRPTLSSNATPFRHCNAICSGIGGEAAYTTSIVMAGLVPAIHVLSMPVTFRGCAGQARA
jgi:hypothetical protein